MSTTDNVLAAQHPPGERPGRPLTPRTGMRAGWRLLLFLVIYIVFQAVLAAVLMISPAGRTALQSMAKGVFTPFGVLALQTVNVLSALASIRIMGAIEHRALHDYGFTRRGAFGGLFWRGTAWGLCTVVALFAILWAERVVSFSGLALHGWAIAGYAGVWALGALLIGISEELVFRGYVQTTLTTAMGFWPAAVLSSVIFGAAHMLNPGMSLAVGLSATVFGFFFCLTVRRTGTLWFAIGMHAAFDYGETFLFSPSGGTNATAHLLDGRMHGPAWLTGGTIGPEASLNGALAFIALLFLFSRLYRREPGDVTPNEHEIHVSRRGSGA